MNNFNAIALIYDFLASLVFRGHIFKAQTQFIHFIKPNNKVLIVGGGSGKVLRALHHLKIPIAVDFVEPSDRMMKKAKKRVHQSGYLKVEFHQRKFEEFNTSKTYDCICCFFFLDLFNEHSLNQNLKQIKKLMKDTANLIVSDFQDKYGKTWHNVLSKIMHAFFKLTTRLESNNLKDINTMITDCDFERLTVSEFFNRFIFSAVYRKNVSKNGNHS